MELSTAVAIISNGGRDVVPFAIRYIRTPDGKIIHDRESEVLQMIRKKTQESSIQIISPALAFILRSLMKDVADRGSARQGLRLERLGAFQGDIACKTGTTSNFSDAWLTAFNPEYVATAWFGFDKSRVTLGPGQSGGSTAAPVVGSFFRRIYEESKSPAPKFKDLPDARPPSDVTLSPCGGWAVKAPPLKGNSSNEKKSYPFQSEKCIQDSMTDTDSFIKQQMGIRDEQE